MLLNMATESFGPCGSFKLIHDNPSSNKGIAIATSSSTRILQAYVASKTDDPFIQTFFQMLRPHIEQYAEAGLYAWILTISLLQARWTSLSAIPASTLARVTEIGLHKCLSFLSDPACPVRIPLSFSSLTDLSQHILSILFSKKSCRLLDNDAAHLVTTFIDAFLLSLPDTRNIRILCVEGLPIDSSKVLHGVLIRSSELHESFQEDLWTNKDEDDGTHSLRVMLVGMSLSMHPNMGALQCTMGVDYLASPESRSSLLMLLNTLVQQIVTRGVELLICQRVVHPTLRELLTDYNIQVIDRVSNIHMGDVICISGGMLLDTYDIAAFTDDTVFGKLACPVICSVDGRYFLHLSPSPLLEKANGKYKNGTVVTVVLCAPDQNCLLTQGFLRFSNFSLGKIFGRRRRNQRTKH